MNNFSISPNSPLDEVTTLRQRLLELEQSHSQQQQQIQHLQQQLEQEKAARQRSEEQLHLTITECEQAFRAVVENTPDIIVRYDRDLRHLYINPSIERALGIAPEQFIGKTAIELGFTDERSQAWNATLRQVFETGQSDSMEYEFPSPTGELRLYQARFVPELVEEGQIITVLGIATDVTEYKQSEADAAKSNQTLQAIIQACPLAIMGLRSDGIVRIWNPAAQRIFGWSQSEVLGKFLPAISENKREEFLANLAATIRGQGLTGVETQRQKKGNLSCDVELWTAPVDEAQAGISCVAVVADITTRKQTEAALRLSEERLHSFVSANVIGILFGDLEGGIQEANDEFLRIVGYTREDLQVGNLRWVEVTPPEYLPLDEEAIVEARSRGACTPYEKEYICKDGSRVPVLVGFSLVFTVREEAIAFILDLSDRKAIEAEREQLLKREQIAREQAEAANRVKDEFLAVLSHELRTPLNPILGWTKLLRTRSFDPQVTDRALATIERSAKLQTQLIEDLLDVSRILQGKLRLKIAPVNLASTIEAALEAVHLTAEARGIQIQTDLNGEVGQVNGDASRLQQVVWNLLSNSIKFTPIGGRVEVRLTQIETDAQIQVSDTGQGISPNFLPHVFDYFRQADSSSTRKFGGLGLGLAIVRRLAELHGGTVQAESAGEGLGATFTVRLPLISAQSKAEAASFKVD